MGRTISSPGGVPGQRHPARAAGHAEDEGQAGQEPLGASGGAHHGHGDRFVLPEHGVVLEEHRIRFGQRHLDDGHHAGVELAAAGRPVDLGQVAQPGCFPPPESLTVSRTSSGAPQRSHVRAELRALGMAPTALDALFDSRHSVLTLAGPDRCQERYHKPPRPLGARLLAPTSLRATPMDLKLRGSTGLIARTKDLEFYRG